MEVLLILFIQPKDNTTLTSSNLSLTLENEEKRYKLKSLLDILYCYVLLNG